MMNLNLCADPWLPVRMRSGNCVRVSLEEFFSKAHEISDLILAAHERISIMRLLICITQRAINGPADRDEWEDCKDEIMPKALAYLQKWRHSFNLLGEDGAFLQVSGVRFYSGNWKGLSKLNLSSAEGNNPTVFDNGATTERFVDLERLAIDLITFQNFAPSGKIGQVCWCGNPYPNNSSATEAPCILKSAIHMFYVGENVLETIWLNLCTIEEVNSVFTSMGIPVWEFMPHGSNDVKSIENAQETYLGRLVPLSRFVKIDYSIGRCLISNGLDIPSDVDGALLFFEPSTTLELISKDRRLLSGNISCELWRHLPALLHRFNKKGRTLASLEPSDMPDHYGIWVGSLVAQKAKILGTMEDYYEHLSPQSMDNENEVLHYEVLEYAKHGCEMCVNSIQKYHELLSCNKEGKVEKDKKKVEKLKDRIKQEYWSALTDRKNIYVNLMRIGKYGHEWEVEKNLWIDAICKTAWDTYKIFTSQEGARRLAAWSSALNLLPSRGKLLKDEK